MEATKYPHRLVGIALAITSLVGCSVPLATPTATPAPTDTRFPTNTPLAINTPAPSRTPLPDIGSTWVRPADEMVMVFVPGGSYRPGNPREGNRQGYWPSYWIDQTEVTNAMYALCVQAGACQPPRHLSSSTRTHYYDDPEYAGYPVLYIAYGDARDYCSWVGGRLPTWVHWEKAARGADGRLYPWGTESPTCELADFTQYLGNNEYSQCVGDTTAVGSYPAGRSPHFAYDMSGNVAEWVSYVCDYYPADELACALDPDHRQIRGGSWAMPVGNTDVTFVFHQPINDVGLDIGFRCMREP